jgi:lipopolysaccharide export LptBFGC system permease protein LptF
MCKKGFDRSKWSLGITALLIAILAACTGFGQNRADPLALSPVPQILLLMWTAREGASLY